MKGFQMKKSTFYLLALLIVVFMSCNSGQDSAHLKAGESSKDGIFIHISHGSENPHRVLMALNMAVMMAESRDVLVYFDIKGIEVVLKESPDIAYSHFPTSHPQLEKLIQQKVTVMACPGCLKAAGKTPDDLMSGIQIANKDQFFNFTSGRILTIDY
jgi:intracellular sulfur oxidation DsrE/DsrF family protein